jgi:hypothetical protein
MRSNMELKYISVGSQIWLDHHIQWLQLLLHQNFEKNKNTNNNTSARY